MSKYGKAVFTAEYITDFLPVVGDGDGSDMDQVHSDLRDPKQLTQLKALVPDEDKPGLGQFHCVECAKYFESEWNMVQHRRGKNHKRR